MNIIQMKSITGMGHVAVQPVFLCVPIFDVEYACL